MGNPTVIVGAGLAGLVAAGRLQAEGHRVVVLEAGPVPGGRLATALDHGALDHGAVFDGAVFDHGAQFFTVRSPTFAAAVDDLLADGLVYEWCRGFQHVDGYPRYAVRGGMAAWAARLAAGIDDVRLDCAVTAVTTITPPGGTARYRVSTAVGATVDAASVVLTMPVPLALPLLAAGAIAVEPALAALTYHRVLALLVELDGPSAVPAPGGVQLEDGPFSFVADNRQKGISPAHAVTLHTSHRTSAELWEEADDRVIEVLSQWAGPWLGEARPRSVRLVRWAHSGPVQPWPEAVGTVAAGLYLAGDGFAGPKVEGAYLSGWAAAQAVLSERPPAAG